MNTDKCEMVTRRWNTGRANLSIGCFQIGSYEIRGYNGQHEGLLISKKHPIFQREYSTLKHEITSLYCILFRVFFACLDPDTSSGSTDPIESGSGSAAETLKGTIA
jgi:hypothetical protein